MIIIGDVYLKLKANISFGVEPKYNKSYDKVKQIVNMIFKNLMYLKFLVRQIHKKLILFQIMSFVCWKNHAVYIRMYDYI